MKVGDAVKVKVVKIDAAAKKIGLSIKAYEENLDPSQIEEVPLEEPQEGGSESETS